MKTVIGVVIALAVTACGKSEEGPPRALRDLDSSIASVQETPAELKILMNARAVFRTKDAMENASLQAARISERMLRYFPDVTQEWVSYVVIVDLEDKYGKQSSEPILEIKFSTAELRKVDFQNIHYKKLLDLAAPMGYMTPVGAEVVREWCAEQDNRQYARRFCKANTR